MTQHHLSVLSVSKTEAQRGQAARPRQSSKWQNAASLPAGATNLGAVPQEGRLGQRPAGTTRSSRQVMPASVSLTGRSRDPSAGGPRVGRGGRGGQEVPARDRVPSQALRAPGTPCIPPPAPRGVTRPLHPGAGSRPPSLTSVGTRPPSWPDRC